MKTDQYVVAQPTIAANPELREPQILAFEAIEKHDFNAVDAREVSVVLPVGCGKSGLLALAPFATKARRALLVAPNLKIADQLLGDLTPSNPKYFYTKRKVLDHEPFPEPAEIRGTSSNIGDLEEADIVVTNIQQLQRDNNKWLGKLPSDFFDLILFDEGHHNVAESWDALRRKFPDARILNVSATPARADGKVMTGQVIYSYPISKAVEKGYIKRINGYRLNPTTLHYVRHEGGTEVEVSLNEVRRLGEEDAGFRRSIVSSEATLTTIAEASIRKLQEMRESTGQPRLKIIASALNMEHCKQVVAKYRELGMRADFVHSLLAEKANGRIHEKLENHELDVIVQVRKLGEGFDHPYLSVAAVFSIFSNLGPFMQFVGRIMRTIPGVDAFDPVNDGVVVFHVGGNITGVWTDFQEFAEADQVFFANLIDENLVEPTTTREPGTGGNGGGSNLPVITAQDDVLLENLTLLTADPKIAEALAVLKDAGISTGEQFDRLQRITPTKQASRKAKRALLDELVKTAVGRFLAKHNLKHAGRDFDKTRENFKVAKSAIDLRIKKTVPSGASTRSEYSTADLDHLIKELPNIIGHVEEELRRG
ncbi:DEAD/DEAH box helicase family protein [Leucobacter sp. UT-8R-CII-1-4]|uniref:DEAD/DEAH box helicase n=1 Tax=Leucobacter sp. UT-8R-CII-1-4 TaxID=3040075 RepID=UPI0024A89410|nr:DEAD/DEAH box helicase family protein [Leucobacter sp. UT-8R-CII-1-4]MDI6024048.1 DEAD/DEAH box helicase family protein [Leucobacter sp. UT-8R-CII-1-4]